MLELAVPEDALAGRGMQLPTDELLAADEGGSEAGPEGASDELADPGGGEAVFETGEAPVPVAPLVPVNEMPLALDDAEAEGAGTDDDGGAAALLLETEGPDPVAPLEPLKVTPLALDERAAELLLKAAAPLVVERPLPESETVPVADALAEETADELPDGAAPDEEVAESVPEVDDEGAAPDDEDEGAAVSHGSLMNSTSVGPMTREAVVPPTSTISVKMGGKAAPLDAQGTGMIFTNVPMVVVMVEHAVTVPVGSISPLVMKISGGASAGA